MKSLDELARADLNACNYIECTKWMLDFLETGAMYPPENDPLDEFSLDEYSLEDVASIFIHRNYMLCRDILGEHSFGKYIEQHLMNMDKEEN